jgi:hypothetical protein
MYTSHNKATVRTVNVSIREGIFPSKLKKSVVRPIYKKGKKEEAINYRPVTLVPALSKVLEKVISNQLIAFLERHNILNKSQYRFRKNESMNVAIDTIIENIIEILDNKTKCNCVLLDLSKASDCI